MEEMIADNTSNNELKKTSKRSMAKSIQNNDEGQDKRRYIYNRKDKDDELANRIDEILLKCNDKNYGEKVEFAELLEFAIKLISEAHISTLMEQSITNEERVKEMVKKFNEKNNTNYDVYQFIINNSKKI